MRGRFEILIRELKSDGWVLARFMVSDCVANVVRVIKHGVELCG